MGNVTAGSTALTSQPAWPRILTDPLRYTFARIPIIGICFEINTPLIGPHHRLTARVIGPIREESTTKEDPPSRLHLASILTFEFASRQLYAMGSDFEAN